MSRKRPVLRWTLRILGVVVLYYAAGLSWAWSHDRSPAGSPMGEYVTPDEDFVRSQIIASAIGLSTTSHDNLLNHPPQGKDIPTSAATAPGYSPADYRRDVHQKSHGCLNATFTVSGDLSDRFKYGLFSKPASYPAIIRLSSGQPKLNPDSVKDARGFALKVLNVPGKKLLPGEEDGTAQDFIMINSPVFFIRTIKEYVEFSKVLGADPQAIHYFLPSFAKPWTWKPREMKLALGSFRREPKSLVTERYYSLSAYKLGPSQYVKYSIKPCSRNHPMPPSGEVRSAAAFDYLREELENQSKAGDACFDFMVQPQVAGKNMPVEDATVEWSEKDSPFIKVASITIQKGDNNTEEMNRTCESLSFNPWHSLPEHEPVGTMNRVRKSLYQAVGNFRRAKNCQSFCATECTKVVAGKAPCSPGCSDACMAKCPLFESPPKLQLPEVACYAAATPATKTDQSEITLSKP
jgi:hypothetical protein